jgi:fucose permease
MKFMLLFAAFISFIMLGMSDSVFGVAWPGVRQEFNLPLEMAFVITMSHAGSYALAGAVLGKLEQKYALYKLNAAGLIMIATGMLLISITPSFPVMAVFALVLGFGCGITDSALNAFAARHFSARQMNLLHCMWGAGASIAPVIMTQMLLLFSWRAGYVSIAVLQAFVIVFILFTIMRGIWIVQKSEQTGEQTQSYSGILYKKRYQAAHMGMFFLYVIGEAGMGLWIVEVMMGARGLDIAVAGLYPAVYWGAIMLGRLIFGFIADRFTGDTIVRVGLIAAGMGAALMIFSNSIAGIALTGLGLAPVFPALMTETAHRFREDIVPGLVGRQISAVGIGAAFGAVVMGQLLARVHLNMLFPVVIGCSLAVFLINEIITRTAKRAKI